MDILAMDGDGHVEEWEATWSDDYLEPAFRDRRPKVIETGEFEHDFIWEIDGERIRIGGSPSSKDGVVSTEYEKMAKWRGPHESGEFHSAEARLAVMDAENTYLSVNYPTLLLSWPIASDPALNAALTRSYNNWVADVSNQSPDRLKWVTAIDPRDPAEAVREMERTKKMGSVGVMVFGDYSDRALDDPSLECFWAAAQDLDMPVNVHPGTGARDAMKTYRNIAGDQFLMSVVRGFKTICGSGILDRYPKVKVSFLETGCTWVDFAVAVMDFTLDNVKDRLELGTIRRTQSHRGARPAGGDAAGVHQERPHLHRLRGRRRPAALHGEQVRDGLLGVRERHPARAPGAGLAELHLQPPGPHRRTEVAHPLEGHHGALRPACARGSGDQRLGPALRGSTLCAPARRRPRRRSALSLPPRTSRRPYAS